MWGVVKLVECWKEIEKVGGELERVGERWRKLLESSRVQRLESCALESWICESWKVEGSWWEICGKLVKSWWRV